MFLFIKLILFEFQVSIINISWNMIFMRVVLMNLIFHFIDILQIKLLL